jgi:hypothetical protein
MQEIDFDGVLDCALALLSAAAEKDEWLAPLSARYKGRMDWRSADQQRRQDALLLLAVSALARSVGVKLATLELPPIVPQPVVMGEGPLGENDGVGSLNQDYLEGYYRQPTPLAPSTRLSQMLGRPLTGVEWAQVEEKDEQFLAERRGSRVQEMPKVEQPKPEEPKEEPAKRSLEQIKHAFGIK